MGRPGVGLFFLLALLPVPVLAANTVIRGRVVGAAKAPLVNVHVAVDEFGVSDDTKANGEFKLTLPPGAEKKVSVTLRLTLADYQTESLDVPLPPSRSLEITLTPLYTRTLPTLPQVISDQLRAYRKEEIRHVQDFLGSKAKKLLSVEGVAGVGSSDLVLVALNRLPKAVKREILWWDCEETDSLIPLAEELARRFPDQSLGNLVQTESKPGGLQAPYERERAILDRILAGLQRKPHTIVLNRFDRWLSSDGIKERFLAEFLSRFVDYSQTGKLILLAEPKPALPLDLNRAWIEPLVVKGLAPDDALDFLRSSFRLSADPGLLRDAAERLGGHPRLLELLGNSLQGHDKKRQEDRLRQFLQVGESLGDPELGPLLASTWARLTPLEGQILDLVTVVRRPLTAGQMQEVGINKGEPFTSEQIRKGTERLANERYWLETLQDARTGEARFRLAEVVRRFLEDRLEADRGWKTELHRRALAWYQRKFPVDAMDRMTAPPAAEVVAGYDELIHQALCLGELTDAAEKNQAILLGGQVLEKTRDWHSLHDSAPLLLSQLERAQRLLETQTSQEGRTLLANALKYQGDLYVTASLAEAKKRYEEALSIYGKIELRLGKGDTLKALGDLHALAASPANAEKLYKEALQLYEKIGERRGEANTLMLLGGLNIRAGRRAEAAKLYEKALPLFHEVEDRLSETNTLMSLGELYAQMNRREEAAKLYNMLWPLYEALKTRLGEVKLLESLDDLYPQIKITGMYSNLEYREDAGGLRGIEVYLVYGGSSYYAMVQCAGLSMVTPVEISGAKVSFELPEGQPKCGASFSGTISLDGLRGRFVDEKENQWLPRQKGYWAR